MRIFLNLHTGQKPYLINHLAFVLFIGFSAPATPYYSIIYGWGKGAPIKNVKIIAYTNYLAFVN